MTRHAKISYAKSLLRIVGFGILGFGHLAGACFLLILAEMLGIAEELPGAYKGTETE